MHARTRAAVEEGIVARCGGVAPAPGVLQPSVR